MFALALDREKMTERIVIAESQEARRRLEQGTGEVYYDQLRPLGELLIGMEADRDRLWNVNAMQLCESYGKILPFKNDRWELANPAGAFLQEKYRHGEPSAMFSAIRTWEEYLNCYHLNHGSQRFIDNMTLLYRPFFLYGDSKPWQKEAADVLTQVLHAGESQVELWYPVRKRPFECVVAFSSLLPVIFYYLHKIEEWDFVFQECKVCGKHFLARSKHYELCGDECRKVQAVQAKREFDERAKGDLLEQTHEAAYYYWYNRLRKLKRAEAAPEKVAAVSDAFEAFRKEAVRQKSEVKNGTLKLGAFTSWLSQQQDVIDGLMGAE